MEGFGKLLDWAVAACGALLIALYGSHERRMLKLEAVMPSQFERDELARQRVKHEEHIRRLFEKIEQQERTSAERHIELLEKLAAKADR